ncbi:MAG: class I SAM-dependent methyltransferase, partial [Caldisphaera sp.]
MYMDLKGTNDYYLSHRERIMLTLKELEKYVLQNECVLNVGVSSIDDLLIEKFKFIDFGLPPSLQNLQDGITRNIVTLDFANSIYPSKKYDLIIFTEVLEHLMIDDKKVIEALWMMLNENGILLLSVPNALTLKNRLKVIFGKNPYWPKSDIVKGVYGGYGHIREYAFSEIPELLDNHFKILSLKGINYLIPKLLHTLRQLKDKD